MLSLSKIFVVTVTYGDRFNYLKYVVDAAFKEKVDKIIIIDNNSHLKSQNNLRKLAKKFKNKIKVIHFDENKGSAGGYKRGLEEALKDNHCEFIWLLDDDNKPLPGALEKLINFYNSLPEKEKFKSAVTSFRPTIYNNFNFSSLQQKDFLFIPKKDSFFRIPFYGFT